MSLCQTQIIKQLKNAAFHFEKVSYEPGIIHHAFKAGKNKESIKFRRRVKEKNTTIAVVQFLDDSSLDADSLWIDFIKIDRLQISF